MSQPQKSTFREKGHKILKLYYVIHYMATILILFLQ